MNEIHQASGLCSLSSIEDLDIDVLVSRLKRLVYEEDLDPPKIVLRDYLMNSFKHIRAYAKPINFKYQEVRTVQFTVYNGLCLQSSLPIIGSRILQ